MSATASGVRFLSDEDLLRQCREERMRGSGPGVVASLSVSLPVQRLAANRKRIVTALREAGLPD